MSELGVPLSDRSSSSSLDEARQSENSPVADENLRILKWFVADAVDRQWQEGLKIIIKRLLVVGLQLATFGLVFAYVQSLEGSGSLGFVTSLNLSPAMLALAVATSAFTLFFALALLSYGAEIQSVNLRKKYEDHGVVCVAVLGERQFEEGHNADDLSRIFKRIKLAHRGIRSGSRILHMFLAVVIPLFRLIASVGILIYISLAFSLVVFILTLVAFIFFRQVYTEASTHANEVASAVRSADATRARIMGEIPASEPTATTLSDALHQLLFNPDECRHRDSYFFRFFLAARTGIIVNLLAATSLLLVVIAGGIGSQLTTIETFQLSVFFAFVVALRVFLGDLMNVGRTFTEASRLFPDVWSYHDLVVEGDWDCALREGAAGSSEELSQEFE